MAASRIAIARASTTVTHCRSCVSSPRPAYQQLAAITARAMTVTGEATYRMPSTMPMAMALPRSRLELALGKRQRDIFRRWRYVGCPNAMDELDGRPRIDDPKTTTGECFLVHAGVQVRHPV